MAKVNVFEDREFMEGIAQNELEDSFLRDFYSTILESQEESKPSTHFVPSSITCPRNMYYRKTGKKAVNNKQAQNILIGNSGTDAHNRNQAYLELMQGLGKDWEYIDVEKYIIEHKLKLEIVEKKGHELKLYSKKYDISFLCDGILYNKVEDKYFIFELKTEVMKKWYKQEGILPEHYAQGATYSMLFNIPRILYLYEGRDFCSHKAYIHTYTKDEIKRFVLDNLEAVKKSMSGKTLPNKNTDFENVCRFCAYKSYCKKDEL